MFIKEEKSVQRVHVMHLMHHPSSSNPRKMFKWVWSCSMVRKAFEMAFTSTLI